MNIYWKLCALALAIATSGIVRQARAQDPNSASPDPLPAGYAKRPAGAAPGVSPTNSTPLGAPAQARPDTTRVAGAQMSGLGYLQPSHNIFDPSLSVTMLGATFPNPGGTTGLFYTMLPGGSLNFDHTHDRYHTIIDYTGGAYITLGSQSLITQFQDATLSQEIDWQRWRLLLRDDFVATPGAYFTGTGLGGPGMVSQMASSFESSLNMIGQSFIPAEAIQNGNAMRYMNSAMGQIQYDVSRKSVLTAATSYGLLHFTTPGFIGLNQWTSQVGYDYKISPANSIGILGGAGVTNYPGTSNSIANYLAALAFGRKITGRLAFQVAGDGEHIRSTNSGSIFQSWNAMATASLSYARPRDGFSVMFFRGFTAGSGVLYGAESNMVTVSAHRSLTRFWTASVSGGYASNSSLPITGTTSFQFYDWFGGASLGRRMGRHFVLNFNYGAQDQNSPANCPVLSCGVPGLLQTFGMSLSWHVRPAG